MKSYKILTNVDIFAKNAHKLYKGKRHKLKIVKMADYPPRCVLYSTVDNSERGVSRLKVKSNGS